MSGTQAPNERPNKLRANARITAGDPAPDCALTNSAGEAVTLSQYWREKPLTLVFLRHFGCVFCREQVAVLRRDYQKLLAAGTRIVCVANGPYKAGRAFEIFFDLPFAVLVSDTTEPFEAYGLAKATLGQLFNPAMVLHGLNALLHGHVQGKVIGDPYQLPGTFIIDTQGIVRFVHRNRDAADHTTVDMILSNLPRGEAG